MGSVEPAIFWLLALIMCGVAFAFIMFPAWLNRRHDADEADRRLLNVSLFRERLAELEQEKAEGELTEETFQVLKHELELSLLEEVPDASGVEAESEQTAQPLTVPLVLALAIPLLALILYADFGVSLGAMEDLELTDRLRQGVETEAEQNQLVNDFRNAMLRQPDNHEGWYMLGQSYYNLERYREAAAVFRRLMGIFPGDGKLAGAYAEALFMAEGRVITPLVSRAIDEALSINPHQLSLLEIRAMAAFEAGDITNALRYFRQALNAGASDRQKAILEEVIGRLEVQQAELAKAEPVPDQSMPPAPVLTEADQGRSIQVSVKLAEGLEVTGQEIVFIFARAFQGPPMPLAVQRMPVTALPTTVVLTEEMAMMPNMSLATFDRVQVVARVSRSGAVDEEAVFYAESDALDMTQALTPVMLTIEGS